MIEPRVEAVTGAAVGEYLAALAVLRIEVFREWPYLYDGDAAYEERYLAPYVSTPDTLVAIAWAGDELIGLHYGGALSRWRPGHEPDAVAANGYYDAERSTDRSTLWLLARTGQIARYRDGVIVDLFRAPGAEALTATRDGHAVALALLDRVELHDLVDGTTTTLLGSGDHLLDVAISPDDRWLAAATIAGTIDVWSLADRRWVAHLRGHHERAVWVGFAADALWSASWDGALLRWDLGALAAEPRVLTADAAATWALPPPAASP